MPSVQGRKENPLRALIGKLRVNVMGVGETNDGFSSVSLNSTWYHLYSCISKTHKSLRYLAGSTFRRYTRKKRMKAHW